MPFHVHGDSPESIVSASPHGKPLVNAATPKWAVVGLVPDVNHQVTSHVVLVDVSDDGVQEFVVA